MECFVPLCIKATHAINFSDESQCKMAFAVTLVRGKIEYNFLKLIPLDARYFMQFSLLQNSG